MKQYKQNNFVCVVSFLIFSFFVEHFLSRVVIFYGEPLVTYRGSSFWIDVEWTFPSFLLRAFFALGSSVGREHC